MRACLSASEVLALKHESRILRQRSNPVSGSRKSQTSSPWAKHGYLSYLLPKFEDLVPTSLGSGAI